MEIPTPLTHHPEHVYNIVGQRMGLVPRKLK